MDFTIMTEDRDHWKRDDLTLTQRCYTEDEIQRTLAGAGFDRVEVAETLR